jgi:hypothetical protein
MKEQNRFCLEVRGWGEKKGVEGTGEKWPKHFIFEGSMFSQFSAWSRTG